ncbi:MAG: LD-carboxypeptidase [Pseudomonadota bacterium]
MTLVLYKPWQPLTQGAIVDIIAPAGGCTPDTLEQVKTLLQNWQLIPRVSPDVFGTDLLCANTDENRFQQLQEALFNTGSSAVWCLRGGYGCTRLIPELLKLKPPKTNKLFIGFSDITTLHLFLQQKWHWQTLHGPSASQVAHGHIDSKSIQEFKKVIFGQLQALTFSLFPLNDAANQASLMTSPVVGGNLTLIQTSLATPWQIDIKNKILFLEEVNEAAYRIDRMLQHLQQSGILQPVKAVLFGDFIPAKKSNDRVLIQSVLKRFAETQNFPVLHCPDVGHGETNRSLPLATSATLDVNKKHLTIKITG